MQIGTIIRKYRLEKNLTAGRNGNTPWRNCTSCKQAAICLETGRKDEALRMYEELLYAGYQNISLTFHDIYHCALKSKDYIKAHQMVKKMKLLAQLFEMGNIMKSLLVLSWR